VGLGVEAARLVVIALAVMLAAVATAAAGPVGLVAFVAGPIARRLTRGSPRQLAGSVSLIETSVPLIET
jgi:iron complex transport system permease protein